MTCAALWRTTRSDSGSCSFSSHNSKRLHAAARPDRRCARCRGRGGVHALFRGGSAVRGVGLLFRTVCRGVFATGGADLGHHHNLRETRRDAVRNGKGRGACRNFTDAAVWQGDSNGGWGLVAHMKQDTAITAAQPHVGLGPIRLLVRPVRACSPVGHHQRGVF